jgi:hypothetical protein
MSIYPLLKVRNPTLNHHPEGNQNGKQNAKKTTVAKKIKLGSSSAKLQEARKVSKVALKTTKETVMNL